MKYLLDTHIWLWSLLEPQKLPRRVLEVFQNLHHELFISPITIWETLILSEKRKIQLNPSASEWITEALQRSPVQEVPLSHLIALKNRVIELPHQDPADRFIAATAWEYEMTLITMDEPLRNCSQIRIL